MRAGLSNIAVSGALSTKVHPHTGEPIVPLGFRRNGDPIWPIMGASEDDDPDDDEPDNDDEPDDEPDDAEPDTGTKKQDRKLTEENARRRKLNKQLQEQLDAANARLKEIDDADKDEITKSSETIAELTSSNQSLTEKVAELSLKNAFLSDTTHKWKNPKVALRLADLSEVEIDEDGEVTGLSEALKKLAKSEPYLLAGADDDEDDEPEPSAGQPPRTKRTKQEAGRESLTKKYPALRR